MFLVPFFFPPVARAGRGLMPVHVTQYSHDVAQQ